MSRLASRGVQAALAFALIACAGKPAPQVADPSRGLKALATEDREVSDIAIAAARSLPISRTGQPLFAGVYVNERKSRSATDAVKRATGFPEVSRAPRPRELRCMVRSSSGQEREIPCPPAAVSAVPPTFTFVEVRATEDSAYVGIEETDDRSEKASCITLLRRIGGWSVLSTSIIASAKNCGK
jgi:hypothetical protein